MMRHLTSGRPRVTILDINIFDIFFNDVNSFCGKCMSSIATVSHKNRCFFSQHKVCTVHSATFSRKMVVLLPQTYSLCSFFLLPFRLINTLPHHLLLHPNLIQNHQKRTVMFQRFPNKAAYYFFLLSACAPDAKDERAWTQYGAAENTVLEKACGAFA